jgi:hypothetical protein
MCHVRGSLSHRGATRSGSKTWEIRPSSCETDASWTSIASACPSVQTGLAAPRSVSQRDSLAAANAIFSVALTFACWLSKHTYRAYPPRETRADGEAVTLGNRALKGFSSLIRLKIPEWPG